MCFFSTDQINIVLKHEYTNDMKYLKKNFLWYTNYPEIEFDFVKNNTWIEKLVDERGKELKPKRKESL